MNNQSFRRKIHDLIPGGAHTYSKGDDQFPSNAPAAIAYGKGAHVWDVEGNKYLDCGMGLTSVSLGHAYEPVLQKVIDQLYKGINFQRPATIEMEMAEKFLSLVPQHQMIKFAKNGSTVTTAAVKLARAYTGRKLVAFPAEHPFYSYDDWFIGKTACNKGVPDEISALTVTFNACNIDSLRALFEKYPGQIACVITEPEKITCDETCACHGKPGEFLKQAISLSHEQGAVFILDEMVTGFKTDLPGSMKKFGIEPDLATWGKGIANGFSFCALTGKREIMELGGIRNVGAEKVFLISTTHGAETHSLAAGIATIDEFLTKNVISHNQKIGEDLIAAANETIASHALNEYVQVLAGNWMPVFMFRDAEKNVSAAYRTLAMQEMIRRGILFQGVFVPCFSHSAEDIHQFITAFSESLEVYKAALQQGVAGYLSGEIVKPVFRRFL